jgi:transcriptional regulator GlxA family with amidase domain
MDAAPNPAPVRICLLALPETTPASIYGLHEVFASVGVVWQEMTGMAVDVRRLDARIVAQTGKSFASPLGLPIVPHTGLDDAGAPDAIIVTDLALAPDSSPHGRWADEARWVRAQFDRGAIVCSVCTGSVFLAEAGLLDGVEATTHWGAAGIFVRCYPAVRLHPERILCPAGPEHRLVTGGGASAWADLALYLIARFCGRAEAVRIAKIFVLGDHSEGQLPFMAMGRTAGYDDAVIGRCQAWLADHYAESTPVARMAALSALPERTFKRRFKAATGYAPIDYVQALRIEEAKQLLETTGEPTDAIANIVGYTDPAFFRRLFKRMTGVTPARYRQRYRFIGAAAEA